MLKSRAEIRGLSVLSSTGRIDLVMKMVLKKEKFLALYIFSKFIFQSKD